MAEERTWRRRSRRPTSPWTSAHGSVRGSRQRFDGASRVGNPRHLDRRCLENRAYLTPSPRTQRGVGGARVPTTQTGRSTWRSGSVMWPGLRATREVPGHGLLAGTSSSASAQPTSRTARDDHGEAEQGEGAHAGCGRRPRTPGPTGSSTSTAVRRPRPGSPSCRRPPGSSGPSPGFPTRAPAYDGGRLFFEGTPVDLLASRTTATGDYLAHIVTIVSSSPGGGTTGCERHHESVS